eukprot:4103959-Amphidinium_carterae.1
MEEDRCGLPQHNCTARNDAVVVDGEDFRTRMGKCSGGRNGRKPFLKLDAAEESRQDSRQHPAQHL